MLGGEIFIPKFKTMSLKDLADAVAPGCKIKITGNRPGDKLHEQVITDDEIKRTLEFKDYYAILPAYTDNLKGKWPEGKQVPEGFKYTSNSGEKLSKEDLKEVL
jgi:UDP-N-acetylglucosamine 4,6-dehydratase